MAFGARSFNGTSDSINLGSSSTLNPSLMSFSAWVYPTSFPNSYNTFIDRDDGTLNAPFFGVKSTGKLALFFNQVGGGSVFYDGTGSNTLSANTFYHVAFAYPSSGVATGYLNGSVDGTTNSIGANISPVSANTLIGLNHGGTLFFAGRIADVALWNVTLTAAEIAALATGIRPYNIRGSNIIGYWPLDGVNSPEPDLSGNFNNGTLTGTINAAGPPLTYFTPRWPISIDVAAAPPVFQLMGQAML